jgi:hypothetical protein
VAASARVFFPVDAGPGEDREDVFDDLAEQGVVEESGQEVTHRLVGLDSLEECGELRCCRVGAVVGAASLGE